MSPDQLLVFDLERGPTAYTAHEVCEICGVTLERVTSFVEFGVLIPEGAEPEEWRFPAQSILQTRRASRLQRDLELDLPGLALVLELIEENANLRRDLRNLRSHLARFTAGD